MLPSPRRRSARPALLWRVRRSQSFVSSPHSPVGSGQRFRFFGRAPGRGVGPGFAGPAPPLLAFGLADVSGSESPLVSSLPPLAVTSKEVSAAPSLAGVSPLRARFGLAPGGG